MDRFINNVFHEDAKKVRAALPTEPAGGNREMKSRNGLVNLCRNCRSLHNNHNCERRFTVALVALLLHFVLR